MAFTFTTNPALYSARYVEQNTSERSFPPLLAY
jgi:hypothetical protein